jgi:hypothetical protein
MLYSRGNSPLYPLERRMCGLQSGSGLCFWLPLEHGASMKLPVSLQFLNLGHSVGFLERVISSQGNPNME